MATTLLLDLDNTLFQNNMEDFLPIYFQALSNHFSAYAEPALFIEALIGGTQAMIGNQNPGLTLQHVFENHFYPAMGLDKGAVAKDVDRFYEEVFPGLGALTRPWPAAKALVEEALDRGYRLAVTTNPLFPREAILKRLEWADLSAGRYPFELITSFEDSHFAKPNPAYLAEVMARLGWPDEPVVVIGDDPKNDIEAAKHLGLASFKIGDSRWSGTTKSRNACGHLNDILPWMDALAADQLHPKPSSPTALMAVLRSSPAALKTIFNRWVGQPTQRPSTDEWSLTEIICHLRDVELELNLPRIKRVLEEDNPHLTGRDTDTWAVERNYLAQECLPAIEAFVAARRATLELLETGGEAALERPARHTIFGPTNLLELIRISTGHDMLHFRQIYNLKKAMP